jgi:dephospho-CoA kinase
MHMFGLTGGIASGKSVVAQRLRARGVAVVDADQLAREVVAKGSDGLAEVARVFGPEVLAPDGTLDRKRVAEIVFRDNEKRGALNAILHPRIGALTMQRAAELAAKGEPLACYEAALIVENGMADTFRPLVVVAAPEALQVARAVTRDSASEDEARARIRAQVPLEKKVAAADVVIQNDGTLAELVARADDALDRVCAAVGVAASRYPRPAAA